jgi:hypothetical protein
VTLTITDEVMRSVYTEHTALCSKSGRWHVSWLPGRLLDRNAAITAMTIAETVGRIPAHSGPEAYDDAFWLQVDSLAGELGLAGPVAVARASEPPS